MKKQTTHTILMVEPVGFYFNEETAENNYFQTEPTQGETVIQNQALKEFNGMVEQLKGHGIEVITIQDTNHPKTPDSIFPNNWITTHQDGKIGLYPMFAENRRTERRMDVLDMLEEKGFVIKETIDYSSAEEEDVFLEGTGSLILDRVNRLAYAALSDRTDENLLEEFCEDFEYTPIVFSAYQTVEDKRLPIYHTNVMMCVADQYAIVCLDSVDDAAEKKFLKETLENSGKRIIAISEEQMNHFAGNMLQVDNTEDKFLVMSQSAYQSLTAEQIKTIESFNPIIAVDITTIETLGGGSARCMMAEIFLPKA